MRQTVAASHLPSKATTSASVMIEAWIRKAIDQLSTFSSRFGTALIPDKCLRLVSFHVVVESRMDFAAKVPLNPVVAGCELWKEWRISNARVFGELVGKLEPARAAVEGVLGDEADGALPGEDQPGDRVSNIELVAELEPAREAAERLLGWTDEATQKGYTH